MENHGALFGHACHLRLRIEGMHRSSSPLPPSLPLWLAQPLSRTLFSLGLRLWATDITVKRPLLLHSVPLLQPRFLTVFSPFTALVFWTSMPIHTLYDGLYHDDDPRLAWYAAAYFVGEKELESVSGRHMIS